MSGNLYYMDESSWGENEYYALHRYMHKIIYNKDRKMKEIENINVSRMSEKAKVLLYCIIKYYNMDELLDMENLSPLRECAPLKDPLILDRCAANRNTIYERMNVVF